MMKNKILAFAILFFGLLTLFLSSSIIFDMFGIREKEGNYVLAVVWANFIASIIYISAAYALFTNGRWAKTSLIIAVIVLIIGYIALFVHINAGGFYETKTIGAMAFRIILTLTFLILTHKFNKK